MLFEHFEDVFKLSGRRRHAQPILFEFGRIDPHLDRVLTVETVVVRCQRINFAIRGNIGVGYFRVLLDVLHDIRGVLRKQAIERYENPLLPVLEHLLCSEVGGQEHRRIVTALELERLLRRHVRTRDEVPIDIHAVFLLDVLRIAVCRKVLYDICVLGREHCYGDRFCTTCRGGPVGSNDDRGGCASAPPRRSDHQCSEGREHDWRPDP